MTLYTMNEESMRVVTQKPVFQVSTEEEKLILRLRQLKRAGNGEKLLVDPRTGEVWLVGAVERLAK